MLSEKQRNNINKLDTQTCIEIMCECAERIGLVDIETYMKAMGVSRRTTYLHMDKLCFSIGRHKFPIINIF